jgi:hypothetical protein
MMDGALAGEPKLQFHPADPAVLRGTKGSGASGPGKMTYKYNPYAKPKIGDTPTTTDKPAKNSKKGAQSAATPAPSDNTASTPPDNPTSTPGTAQNAVL